MEKYHWVTLSSSGCFVIHISKDVFLPARSVMGADYNNANRILVNMAVTVHTISNPSNSRVFLAWALSDSNEYVCGANDRK